MNCHHRPDYEGRDNLARLDAELNRGRRVAPQDAPGDAITMNSQAQLIDLDTGEELTYTLVFPHAADIRLHKISILAPVGMAMFGYRIGDVFEWEVPAGLRRFKVKAVLYQPEAAENYDL
ncbi:MAG: GreA/GreB family elongation factor [Acidobacteria bacterium]|nr:GreA/GreB family elongation factor [Acidobacteriota bacterium]